MVIVCPVWMIQCGAPKRYKLVCRPLVTYSYLRTINHSGMGLINPLSYRWGPHIVRMFLKTTNGKKQIQFYMAIRRWWSNSKINSKTGFKHQMRHKQEIDGILVPFGIRHEHIELLYIHFLVRGRYNVGPHSYVRWFQNPMNTVLVRYMYHKP